MSEATIGHSEFDRLAQIMVAMGILVVGSACPTILGCSWPAPPRSSVRFEPAQPVESTGIRPVASGDQTLVALLSGGRTEPTGRMPR